jgi:hypothetical protein
MLRNELVIKMQVIKNEYFNYQSSIRDFGKNRWSETTTTSPCNLPVATDRRERSYIRPFQVMVLFGRIQRTVEPNSPPRKRQSTRHDIGFNRADFESYPKSIFQKFMTNITKSNNLLIIYILGIPALSRYLHEYANGSFSKNS